MSDVAVSSPVTEAYLEALTDAGLRIGDGIIPDGWERTKVPASMYPYGVLYVGTTLMQGTLVNPKEDGLHRVQVTSVGRTRESTEWLRDRVRPVLLNMTLEGDGVACVWTELVNSQPVIRDDDVTPAVFFAVDVANALWTPQSGS